MVPTNNEWWYKLSDCQNTKRAGTPNRNSSAMEDLKENCASTPNRNSSTMENLKENCAGTPIMYTALPLSLPFIINRVIQRQHIGVIFSLSSLLWATLDENCLVSVQRDCINLENKRRKLRWEGF